jgi:uncharacterized protein YecA (UPF0149 family)
MPASQEMAKERNNMNCNTGEVMLTEEMWRRLEARPKDRHLYKEVPVQEVRIKTGRNDPCPCGSGVKFKKCCYMEL